jgi:opacity protein-like surface antigen
MVRYQKTSIIIIISIISILFFPLNESPAGNKRFDIEFQTGFFLPDNPSIIGEKVVNYDDSGDITSVTSWGFGYGYEILFSLSYRTPHWIFRINSGGKWLHNGPSEEEKIGSRYYTENRMSIYPVVLNVLKEIETENSRVVPYAGLGAGIYIMRWSEKYVDKFPEFREGYFRKDTKTAVGYNFVIGAKYSILKGLSLKFEYTHHFVRSKMDIRWHSISTSSGVVNAGGSSFRIGLVYRL